MKLCKENTHVFEKDSHTCKCQRISKTIQPPLWMGWICPQCGITHSPLTTSCYCQQQWGITFTPTYTTGPQHTGDTPYTIDHITISGTDCTSKDIDALKITGHEFKTDATPQY